jgi:hypothetical protein
MKKPKKHSQPPSLREEKNYALYTQNGHLILGEIVCDYKIIWNGINIYRCGDKHYVDYGHIYPVEENELTLKIVNEAARLLPDNVDDFHIFREESGVSGYFSYYYLSYVMLKPEETYEKYEKDLAIYNKWKAAQEKEKKDSKLEKDIEKAKKLLAKHNIKA